MRNIDTEAIDATIRPELQCLQEIELNFAIIPIEIRLLWSEEVEVPLPISTIWILCASPSRWSEVGCKIIGR